jgi:hypothetical protein
VGDGGVSYIDPDPVIVEEIKGTKKLKVLLLGGAFLTLCVLALTYEEPNYTPVENAEPYEWTDSCPEDPYSKEGAITKIACDCQKYEMSDWLERGLPTRGPRGGTRYFRVGNDAVVISEGWDNECRVSHIERNFFKVKVSEKGLIQ